MYKIFWREELNVGKVYWDQKQSIDRLIRKILNQISAREKRISEKVHPNNEEKLNAREVNKYVDSKRII